MTETRSAIFSADRRYRYTLKIVWDVALPLVQFIGLNPSTADEVEDDPTLRRCKAFAKSWGANGGIIMTNLFAFRSTHPKDMMRESNPIGESIEEALLCGMTFSNSSFGNCNDAHLWETYHRCSTRIACWGNHGKHMYRAIKVRQMLPKLQAIAISNRGIPMHPLYLLGNLKPVDL